MFDIVHKEGKGVICYFLVRVSRLFSQAWLQWTHPKPQGQWGGWVHPCTFWPYKNPQNTPQLRKKAFFQESLKVIKQTFPCLWVGLCSAKHWRGKFSFALGPGQVAGPDLMFLFPSGEPGVAGSFQGGWIPSHPCSPLWGEGGVLSPGFAYKDRAEQVGRRAISMFLSKLFGFACIEMLSVKDVHASVQN